MPPPFDVINAAAVDEAAVDAAPVDAAGASTLNAASVDASAPIDRQLQIKTWRERFFSFVLLFY